MFNYSSSGKINLTGCGAVFKSINFISKYQKGDTVWLYHKAKKGILESITVKELRILGGGFSSNKVVCIYLDTYNSLYNEYDLIPLSKALELKSIWCNERSNFKFYSSVKIKLHSCNGYDPQPPKTTKFKVGDVVYLKNKAKQGMIESIFIKELKPIAINLCKDIFAIYIDNNNFYYNEDELVDLTEALFLKSEYCNERSNFKFYSSVKIKLHSCNGYDPQPTITTKFKVGEIVYLKNKAKNGLLENIFIKSVKPLSKQYCKYIYALYTDNNNFYYNEEELVTEPEAKILIKEFVFNKINDLSKNKISCNLSKNYVGNCKVQ
jgi:hypothetical protein